MYNAHVHLRLYHFQCICILRTEHKPGYLQPTLIHNSNTKKLWIRSCNKVMDTLVIDTSCKNICAQNLKHICTHIPTIKHTLKHICTIQLIIYIKLKTHMHTYTNYKTHMHPSIFLSFSLFLKLKTHMHKT